MFYDPFLHEIVFSSLCGTIEWGLSEILVDNKIDIYDNNSMSFKEITIKATFLFDVYIPPLDQSSPPFDQSLIF